MPGNTPPTHATMSFGDHLEELRRRLLLALAAPLPLFIVFFFVSDPLIEWILLPVYSVLEKHDLPGELQVLSPQEYLLTKLKISFIAAVVVSAPWLLWQMWSFVAPGLYRKERRFVYFMMPGSTILSAVGVALLYYVMLPLMLHVLVLFAKGAEIDPGVPDMPPAAIERLESGDDVPVLATHPPSPEPWAMWFKVPEMQLNIAIPDDDGVPVPEVVTRGGGRIDQTFRLASVINFTLVLLLGIVIAFQMPLVILLLGWLGLADVAWLRSRRRYALAICGVVSALITPADAVSMLLMLIPLYGLYELGILLLVLAPARAVAEGTVLWRGKKSKPPVKPVRSEDSVPRGGGGDDDTGSS
ncbi:MAG: preprotein translocase subunit TatC [Planctomycetes bacterium]|nr:preprotein translocase subunit TatC [Planctomycetota bacterium]